MRFFELFFIAVGLSMDAFAVALCKGLSMKRLNYRHTIIIAVFFGGFQAIMPLLGWSLSHRFESYIINFDHWVAFVLLAFIGGKMLKEGIEENGETAVSRESCGAFNIKEVFILAIATSLDALAVGITFAFLQVTIVPAISIIGTTTFLLSLVGVALGNKFGVKYKNKAEIIGGVILIFIGARILAEHLNII